MMLGRILVDRMVLCPAAEPFYQTNEKRRSGLAG